MFYLENSNGKLAHKDSKGEHDGLVTENVADAASFATWGEASDYGQNFGPDWDVEEY